MGNFTTFRNALIRPGFLFEAVTSKNAIKDFAQYCKDNGYITPDLITDRDNDFSGWFYEKTGGTGRRAYTGNLVGNADNFLEKNPQYKLEDLYGDINYIEVGNVRALYAKVWNIIAKDLNLPKAEKSSLKNIEDYDPYEKQAIEGWLADHDFEGSKQVLKGWHYEYEYGIANGADPNGVKKMEDYKAKGTNPERIATAIKDLGKLVSRWHWCQKNWPEAEEVFKKAVYAKIVDGYTRDINTRIIAIKAEEAKKKKFEEDVTNADLSKYTPKDRDWEKMIDYMNRKSDPKRLADSCKDANKVVSRFIIASCLGWKAAADAFKQKALDCNYATEAELEAFYRKYMADGVPEKWEGFVEAQKEDLKSGLNMIDVAIDKRIQKILDGCGNITNYEPYEVAYAKSSYTYKYKFIKLTTLSGKEYYLYCGIGDYSGYDYNGRGYGKLHYVAKYTLFDHKPGDEEVEIISQGLRNMANYYCRTMGSLKASLENKLDSLS